MIITSSFSYIPRHHKRSLRHSASLFRRSVDKEQVFFYPHLIAYFLYKQRNEKETCHRRHCTSKRRRHSQAEHCGCPVSYTHLDVYKRQEFKCICFQFYNNYNVVSKPVQRSLLTASCAITYCR